MCKGELLNQLLVILFLNKLMNNKIIIINLYLENRILVQMINKLLLMNKIIYNLLNLNLKHPLILIPKIKLISHKILYLVLKNSSRVNFNKKMEAPAIIPAKKDYSKEISG